MRRKAVNSSITHRWLDWHKLRLFCCIHEAEYEGIWIDFVTTCAVPSDCCVTAENESVGCLDDGQRVRLLVALGMKAGRGESISCRAIEQLELLSLQLAQLEWVVLHLKVADYRRVDRSRVETAKQRFNLIVTCAQFDRLATARRIEQIAFAAPVEPAATELHGHIVGQRRAPQGRCRC